MSTLGLTGLFVAFGAAALSIFCFIAGQMRSVKRKNNHDAAVDAPSRTPAHTSTRTTALAQAGRVATIVAAAALTLCCGILVWAFFVGDFSLEYVLENHSDASGAMGWLYRLSGLWAGRQGSLLFWAWLISVFAAVIAVRTRRTKQPLDNMALMVVQIVLLAFVSMMLFSPDNLPFITTNPSYFNEDGSLISNASLLGMNSLLEHWAMAVHPPTLFIGYAGLTVPFAYAIAALIVGDDSPTWVLRATPYTVFAWLFLGIGIGLGAVWAYVVLGWGGYWGWDAVENASLLPWLIGVALIHSFTVYRTHNTFKRWSVMCACLAFCSVILATFITRSGVVDSVHAFNGDSVSLMLFLVLMVVSLAAGAGGLLARRKTFGVVAEDESDLDSLLSREAGYYINNLILIVFAVLLAYMTLTSALPSFFPFGGNALARSTYDAVARPLGIAYALVMALCPLLGWKRTSARAFWKQARVPGLCALIIFVLLMVYFCTYLLPSYEAIIERGGTGAETLLEQGAPLYYNALSVVGFAVASVLTFNALFMAIKAQRAGVRALRRRLSLIGGSICHLAIGVILVGLIGSSMYVTEVQTYLPFDEEAGTADSLTIQDFTLTYTGNDITQVGDDLLYIVHFDVSKNGQELGSVSPSVQLTTTQQQKLNAAVMGFPLEDLFVVYRGMSNEGALSMDVRINPLITVVWVGFALLIAGSAVALFARRRQDEREDEDAQRKSEDARRKGKSDDGENGSAPVSPLSPEPESPKVPETSEESNAPATAEKTLVAS